MIPSVETFLKLNGNNLFISNTRLWNDIPEVESHERKSLTNELWLTHSKVSWLYKDLPYYNDNFQPFELQKSDIYAKLSNDKSAKISIGVKHFEFKECPDFAKYLSGGLFEEYTFMKLQNIVRYFGKIEGRAVLASCFFPINKIVRKKIDDSKKLRSVSGNNLFSQLEKMIQSGGHG